MEFIGFVWKLLIYQFQLIINPLKPIKTGDILDKRYVEKQVTILRSTPVVAIFQSGGISLSIEVTAMENGGLGDYIKVHSSEYKRTYQGKVISPNQVLIQI